MKAVCALDLSLTATGLAAGHDTGEVLVECHRNGKDRGVERLRRFRDMAHNLGGRFDLAVLEGYSYGSQGKSVYDIGEMGGVVRLALADCGIPTVVLAPSVRAKLATGKGNAKKESVLAEAIRRLGYQGSDNNEADALWLLEAARQHYGWSDVTLPAAHLATLDGVDWPEL